MKNETRYKFVSNFAANSTPIQAYSNNYDMMLTCCLMDIDKQFGTLPKYYDYQDESAD